MQILKKTDSLLTSLIKKKESPYLMGAIRIFLSSILLIKWSDSFRLHDSNSFLFKGTGIVYFLSALSLLIGFKTNLVKYFTAFTCIFIFFYLGIYLGNKSFIHHHTYLLCISIVFLSFSDCGKALSFDSFLNNDSHTKIVKIESWPRILICLQLSALYSWTAIDKCSSLFLSGTTFELILRQRYLGSFYNFPTYFTKISIIIAILTVILELWLAFGLWFKKTFNFTFVIGVFFHLFMYYTLSVSTFSITMITLYLCFLNPKNFESFLKKLFNFDAK